jgi:hypothetical protein
VNSNGGKPKSKTTPDPLAELRARGLVRAPTNSHRDLSLPEVKPSAPVSDLVAEQRR